MPVIGFLSTLSPESISRPVAGFRGGLKEAGYIEGQNVAIEYRWAQGHYDRLPDLAADLVRRKVAVIAASGGDPSPQIAKAATQTIPIVFGMFGDPVREALVDSLSRPGGNATGVTIFGPAAVTKRLQLLHDLVPKAGIIAFLMNPNNPNGNIEMGAAQTAATSLGRQIVVFNASTESDLDAAFARIVQQRIGTLLGASDPFLFNRRDQIVKVDRSLRKPLTADSEDQAIELENQEALEVIEKTETAEINQIEAALKRISKGTYGTCAKCGEPIDPRRLKALPTAATCISCSG